MSSKYSSPRLSNRSSRATSWLLFIALTTLSPSYAEEYEGAWLFEPPPTPKKVVYVFKARAPEPKPLSEKELSDILKIDNSGEAQREDAITNFPEVSVFTGYNFRKEKIVTGLGVELFHNQNKPRRHRWKTQLILGDDMAGLSIGKILVPVVNFEVGPGYDFVNKAWILKFSWYKF